MITFNFKCEAENWKKSSISLMAVRSIFSFNLVLMFQFGDKRQIGSLQIGFDPAVNPLV